MYLTLRHLILLFCPFIDLFDSVLYVIKAALPSSIWNPSQLLSFSLAR